MLKYFILFIVCAIIVLVVYYKETKKDFEKIKKCYILRTDTKILYGKMITRGLIGGALFGNLGAFGGALSSKNKYTTTFLVEYIDGTEEEIEVENDSFEYDELCKKL